MRSLAFAWLALLVACSSPHTNITADDDPTDAMTSDPDGQSHDGQHVELDAPMTDAMGDGPVAGACTTTGNGSLYTQCCIWDTSACPSSMCTFVYDPTPGAAEGGNDGACFATNNNPVGSACQLGTGTCTEDAWCVVPSGTMGTCRLLCDPNDLSHHGCPSSQTCRPVEHYSPSLMGYCL